MSELIKATDNSQQELSDEMLSRWMFELATGNRRQKSEAFEHIWPVANKIAMSIGMRILRDEHLAEDARQETMCKILRAARNYEAKGSVRAWIRKIAQNEAFKRGGRDYFRNRTRPFEEFDDETPEPPIEEMGFEEVETSIQESLLWQIVEANLDELPEIEARTVFLYLGSNYTIDQISKLLHQNELKVSNNLVNGLKPIQDVLKEHGYDWVNKRRKRFRKPRKPNPGKATQEVLS